MLQFHIEHFVARFKDRLISPHTEWYSDRGGARSIVVDTGTFDALIDIQNKFYSQYPSLPGILTSFGGTSGAGLPMKSLTLEKVDCFGPRPSSSSNHLCV